MVSEELLIICSAEELEKLEDVVPVSELDSIIWKKMIHFLLRLRNCWREFPDPVARELLHG